VLALFLPYVLVDPGSPIETTSDATDLVGAILYLVWGFEARNRMNETLHTNCGEANWFNGFWTFVATPLYFNYKVNMLAEGSVSHPMAG
jgi:hypothetical protein